MENEPIVNALLKLEKPCSKCGGCGREADNAARGRMLQKFRKRAKVTLREVAALLNLSIGYISDLEHGRKAWSTRLMNFYVASVLTARDSR